MSKKPSPYIAIRNEKIRKDFDTVCAAHPEWTVKHICKHIQRITWIHLSPKTIENVCYPSNSDSIPPADSTQETLFKP